MERRFVHGGGGGGLEGSGAAIGGAGRSVGVRLLYLRRRAGMEWGESVRPAASVKMAGDGEGCGEGVRVGPASQMIEVGIAWCCGV